MKYIIINLRNFIRNETTVFILTLLCIFLSAVILSFSFGLYHHLEQKKLDGESGIKELAVTEINDPTHKRVTVDRLLPVLQQLSKRTLNGAHFSLDARYEEDETDDPQLNSILTVGFAFCIEDGKVTVDAQAGENWLENHTLLDGSYFTAEQIENGELVCIAFDKHGEWQNEGVAKWTKKYSKNTNGKYVIHGKEYTPIGHQRNTLIPFVPITTVGEGCYIKQIFVDYDKHMTRSQYTELCGALEEAFGDAVQIPELAVPEGDSLKFYNTLLVLCMVLACMSGLVLCMLYEYILLQRRRTLTVYRLCGLTQGRAALLYFMECLLLSVVLYGLSVLTFHLVFLPYLSRWFEYIAASYTVQTYVKLGLVYIGVVALMQYGMIRKQLRGTVVQEFREV